MTPWGAESEYDVATLFGRTILQVAPALDASAEARACVQVAAALSEAGARALVAGAPGPLASDVQACGGIFLPFAAATKNPVKAVLNRQELERLVSEEGAELVHARAGAALAAALSVGARLKIPVAADYAPGIDQALDADTIFIFSRADREEALKLRPDAAARATRALRGVDLRRLLGAPPDAARVRALRDRAGAGPHVRVVIGLGLDVERKKLLLAAAAQLKARNFFANDAQEALCLLMDEAGPAPGAADLRKLGLEGVVATLHSSDRVAACVAAAAVVAPAEDFGLCLAAQALGAPVAALFSGSPIDEILAPPAVEAAARSGWLVPDRQPQTLARAIEEALRLGGFARGELARRARAHARNFSVEHMCGLTLSAYAAHFSSSRG